MVECNTSEYVSTYGRQPRGYGQWAFTFRRPGGTFGSQVVFGPCNYGEARRSAERHARTNGFSAMQVGT